MNEPRRAKLRFQHAEQEHTDAYLCLFPNRVGFIVQASEEAYFGLPLLIFPFELEELERLGGTITEWLDK